MERSVIWGNLRIALSRISQASCGLFANQFTANLAHIMACTGQEVLPETKRDRYQVNLAYTLSILRPRLFTWLLTSLEPDDVLTLLNLIGRTLELKRPSRKVDRPKSRPNPRPRRQYK
jgi:hypothetical protein